MSAPAVKPALPASGAQASRVGSGAPPGSSPNNPPTSASGGPKLPSNPTGSPVKPPGPPNANHAVSSAMPLSLVQDHKAPSNALPQPPVTLPRTPEKTKDLSVTASPTGKPTSNGVEGSPNKSPITLTLPGTDTKKLEDSITATPILNHSAESSAPVSVAGSTPASLSTSSSNANTPTPVAPLQLPVPPTTNVNPPVSALPAVPSQPTSKPEPAAAPSSGPASGPGPAQTKSGPPSSNSTSSVNTAGGKPETSSGAVGAAPPPTTTPAGPAPTSAPPAAGPAEARAAGASSDTPAAPAAAPQAQSPQKQAPPVGAPPAGIPQSGAAGAAPAPEPPAKPAPSAPPEVTKTRIEVAKPEFKVATTPRVSKRKREVKPVAETKALIDPNDDRKSKRVRTRTQPYQSPLPELTYIAKIKNMMKSADDKLIVFYKNEFLAVRNQEGSFYVCQAMQNIYKSSTRIRIRWLSQEKKENKTTDVYTPDFYDVTEFDCILTNLELKKLDKNKYQLPQEERDRTESILKRALDVEKGVAEKPSITEEHPDGLDLSLYRDEAQLKKKRNSNKKGGKKAKSGKGEGGEDSGDESEEQDESEEEGKKKQKAKSKEKKSKPTPKEKTKTREREAPKKERVSERSERGREREAAKRRAELAQSAGKNVVAKPPAEKKAKVASPKPVRKADKPETSSESTIPTRATKSRSAKAAAPQPSKSSPVTRTKDRERRGASTQGRKKPGKKA